METIKLGSQWRAFGSTSNHVSVVAAAILLCNLEAAIIDKEVLKSYAGLILHRDLELPLDQASPSTPISTLPNQLRSPRRPSQCPTATLLFFVSYLVQRLGSLNVSFRPFYHTEGSGLTEHPSGTTAAGSLV